jgi:predicted transcriptional regulator
MAGESYRLNVTLDAEYGARLSRLAQRAHVQEGTLARSLLSTAIDQADPDASNIVELLDGIDGAWERVERGMQDAREGRTIPLDEL